MQKEEEDEEDIAAIRGQKMAMIEEMEEDEDETPAPAPWKSTPTANILT